MKIAHISDLHLRHHLPGTAAVPVRQSRRMPALLKEALVAIAAHEPDLLALTGDLVEHPFYRMDAPDNLRLGRADLELVKEILGTAPCPVAVLYGNHDHPGLFAEVFGDQPQELAVKGHRVLSFWDQEVDCHYPQRLGTERERFTGALADADPRPQIHLQHYLVTPQRNEGYPHTYREGEHLLKAIVESQKVRLVLSGHYHAGVPLAAHEGTYFSCVPAFCQPPHPYRIYEIAADGVVCQEHALWPSGEGPGRKAVFLDRDGTINPQPSYRTGPEDFSLLPGAGPALAALQEAGYALVIVTNQTAVGMGWVTVDTVAAVNDRMAALLAPFGVELDGVYCAYGDPQAVLPHWRQTEPGTKPDPALLLRAAADLGLDLGRSYMVGDRRTDLQAGQRAGCRGVALVETGDGAMTRDRLEADEVDHIGPDVAAVSRWILSLDSKTANPSA